VSGVAQAFVSALLFGASTPASKWLLAGLTPLQLAGLLYLGAALGMALPFARERRAGAAPSMGRTNALRLFAAIALGGVAGPVLLLEGLRISSAGSVSLLLNLEMAATALLGVLFFREPLGPIGWLGVLGAVAAGALVSGDTGWPGFVSALWVAAACLCWGFDNQLTARIDGITPARSTFWKGAVAGAINLALGLAAAPFTASGPVVAASLAVGALAYGVSVALHIGASQQLGATRAQAIFATAPFVGAALSWGVLGEPIAGAQLAGGALLVGSVALLLRSRHEHRHHHAATEHVHAHRHDDAHHTHAHPGLAPEVRHSHWHRHEPLVHAHPHWPDLHHRHGHAASGARSEP
jgi:drug/metabolite transporter (DMT)-like permease